MRGLGVLRSHGGRWQAIQDGEVHVDIAVIAAPWADPFGTRMGRMARRPAGPWTSRSPTRPTPTG